MKPTFTLIMLIVTTMVANATIFRVNNEPDTDPDFTIIQDAVDAAVAGDTILIEGGTYAGFTTDKKLIIYGTCYGNTDALDLPVPISAINSDVVFARGSKGSYLAGFDISSITGVVYLEDDSLMITRNNINSLVFRSYQDGANSSSNIIIADNIIERIIADLPFANDTYSVTKTIISNNVISGISIRSIDGLTFRAFFDQNVISGNSIKSTQCIYTNCIFSSTAQNLVFTRDDNNVVNYCVVANNFVADVNFHIGENNVIGATDIFDGIGFYVLSPTSQAAAVGTYGQNAGIYEGDFIYTLGGYAPIPFISGLSMPANVQGTLNVDVKAKILD